ncbi:MAG: glycosyltransferase family 4 protein [Alphaproteobacteria bacterium]|nr:glycosyltransferase family 4 protein [Alphaproteobacteria bacterium]
MEESSTRAERNPAGDDAPRVALVTNIPTPYRNPCYAALARLCNLKVFFNSWTEPDRNWEFTPDDLDYPHEIVRSYTIPYRRRNRLLGTANATTYAQIGIGLPACLRRFRPDVAIGPAFGPTSMLALGYAKIGGARFILWSEGTRHTEAGLSWLRRKQRTMITTGAHGYWTNGQLSSELLLDYGRGNQPVEEGMTGIDTRAFQSAVAGHRPNRAQLREKYGVSGTTFLFVGAVSQRKGVRQMADAFKLAGNSAFGPATLLVAGVGKESAMLAAVASETPGLRIVQLGFVPPHRIPELFAAADVFVLPTLSDNWSLAVLEAAVTGIPQLFSCYNGGSQDLLAAGAAGEIFDPADVTGFAETLARYWTAPPPLSDAAELDHIAAYYGPQAFADRAMKSIRSVLSAEQAAPSRPAAGVA